MELIKNYASLVNFFMFQLKKQLSNTDNIIQKELFDIFSCYRWKSALYSSYQLFPYSIYHCILCLNFNAFYLPFIIYDILIQIFIQLIVETSTKQTNSSTSKNYDPFLLNTFF